MQRVVVIGNISTDSVHRPGRPVRHQLGGAALHLAAASARAGLTAAPAAVIGPDLTHLPEDPRLPALDRSLMHRIREASAAFTIRYDGEGTVIGVETAYGAAGHLTRYALRLIARHPADTFHVSCRQPLDVPAVLAELTAQGARFSVDFHLPSAGQLVRAAEPWLRNATTVFVNAEEYAILTAVTGRHPCGEVVVSDGPRNAAVRRFGHPVHEIVPPRVPVRQITGAGDTLAGTYLACRARRLPPAQALRRAVFAASMHTTHRPLTVTVTTPRPAPS